MNDNAGLAEDSASLTQIAPRIVQRDGLLIVGVSRHYDGSNAGMAEQWDRFAPYIGHMVNQVGDVAYGVVYNADEAGSCDYLCGVQVSEFPPEPGDFTRLMIPPQTYAVFEHSGHVSDIAATWKAIRAHGVSDAGLRRSDGPAFERYGEQFDGRSGVGGFEIWVPVEP